VSGGEAEASIDRWGVGETGAAAVCAAGVRELGRFFRTVFIRSEYIYWVGSTADVWGPTARWSALTGLGLSNNCRPKKLARDLLSKVSLNEPILI
jgi:hypothetical protein